MRCTSRALKPRAFGTSAYTADLKPSTGEGMRPLTQCIHAGSVPDSSGGLVTPLRTTTVYARPAGATGPLTYPRYLNAPNGLAVAAKVAALEGAESGVVLGSGMSAISTSLCTFLGPGDHVVLSGNLYGGTFELVRDIFPAYDIHYTMVNGSSPESFAAAVRPSTRVLYLESPSNPLLRVLDLPKIVAAVRGAAKHEVVAMVDNTFATPINQNPLKFGLDLVVHSGTKYLNGHSDVTCGIVVGSERLVAQVRTRGRVWGGALGPRDCAMLERGLKTLGLRVAQQNANAQKLAEHLEAHPRISRVFYPGLPSHPDHELAKAQMRGFTGMLAFEVKGGKAAMADFVGRLRLIGAATSLGGVESILCIPAESSHAAMSQAELQELGISDSVVRVSVGIEDPQDLIEDIEQAFGL